MWDLASEYKQVLSISETEKTGDGRKRGGKGLGSVEELRVNKACCGEEERKS